MSENHIKSGELSVPILDPEAYGVDFYKQEPAGIIWESRVYKGVDNGKPKALKLYAFDAYGDPRKAIAKVTTAQVRRYQAIIDQLTTLTGKLTSPIPGLDLKISVVPVELLGQAYYGPNLYPCTVNEFIEGQSIEDDEVIKQSLFNLQLQQNIMYKDLRFLHDLLDHLTTQLRNFGVDRAVRLAGVNVKAKPFGRGYEFIVTDPCAEVGRIRV